MPWYVYLAHLFGGAFFANALPHLISGVSGQRMQTPFASPPFQGLSSPKVNVAWALTNLIISYVLLVRVAHVDLQDWRDVGTVFLGFGAMAFQLARAFGNLRNRAGVTVGYHQSTRKP